jgi:PIN domain nuclease of toxin-antitoxin system
MPTASAHRPGPLLLDTHFWIWLQAGEAARFSPAILKAIEQASANGNLLLSVISVWEVGMLEAKRRIHLHMPCEQWIAEALATPGLSVAPLTPEIALESTRLPAAFQGDPADRIIVATARRHRARLLTKDRTLLAYARLGHVSVL